MGQRSHPGTQDGILSLSYCHISDCHIYFVVYTYEISTLCELMCKHFIKNSIVTFLVRKKKSVRIYTPSR